MLHMWAGDIDNIQSASVVTYERKTKFQYKSDGFIVPINDFPARSSLSGWSGQGYKACPTCNEETPSIGVTSKIAYVGHRRFLKKPHKWRSSREFNGQTDNRDPPKEFGRDEILAQLDRLPTRLTGKHPSYGGVKIKRNVLVELNWTKRSIFYELEYWSFLTLRHNLDIMHIEKNVLEAILNTLLMNDKSKDTAKARQDLQRLGIRSGLWLGQTKNGKCLKPQAAYSFTPENRKKFCQFIKGVKLPDGFGSCFKHKVTDNDTNITGLKSHDCHIMMQRLLPYGLQQYLPDKIAKPIIELCSLFKQICSATLMEDDMLKAQIKVVDILCDLELIYPPALFDIMIHLVIHLPLEALEGGPIRPRWMFPFERYMKKLKGYVRNKAKPEGSIAEGNIAEEALTFSSHYFRDVFRSVCKSIGLRSVIRFDAQELKKVKWYVLHICGAKKRRKRVWIKDLCFKHNVDFLGIQKSKMTKLELFRLKSMWGNYSFDYACSLARGRSGGLISMWDPNVFVKEQIWRDEDFIIVKGRWRNKIGDYYMINLYGPHDPFAKIALWNRVLDFIQSHIGKYFLFRDMAHERYGSFLPHNEAEVFNSFINNAGLNGLPMGGHSFTWINKTRTKLSKLDGFLISEDVLSFLPDIMISSLDRMWSDHTPILLHCNRSDFEPVPFKLYHSWFTREGFDEIITSELNNLVEPSIGRKLISHKNLKELKPKIKQWVAANKRNEDTRKKDLMKDLRILDDKIEDGLASNDDRDKRIKILQEAHNLANLEDMDMIQKASVKWDIEGDENSKFFQDLINQICRTQSNNGIMHEGVWITNPIQIKEAFLNFFKEKFKANDSMISFHPTPISHTLQHSDRDFLESTLTMDEVKTTPIRMQHVSKRELEAFGLQHVSKRELEALEKIRATLFWSGSLDCRKLAWLKRLNIGVVKLLVEVLRDPVSEALNLSISLCSKKGIGECFQIRMLCGLVLLKLCMGLLGDLILMGVIITVCGLRSLVPLTIYIRAISSLRTPFASKWVAVLSNLGVRNSAHPNGLLLEISLLNVREDNDKCIWSLDNDGVFAVGPLRRLIDDNILPSLDSPTTWDKTLPPEWWNPINISFSVVTSPKIFGGSFVGGVVILFLFSIPTFIGLIGGIRGLSLEIKSAAYMSLSRPLYGSLGGIVTASLLTLNP
ncbi:zinc finger, PHD-type containing protein [Tanacetum coccineum]|uniref:Zinc finger, PHD-type containing protein n=1 Tax=Tanacetum coccineum TaxID=301880 RepID=A0ABQ5DAH8_9ASTR